MTATAGTPVALARPDVDLRALADARLARLRTVLASQPVDALLLTTPESVAYATGYVSVGSVVFRGWRAAALVTADDVRLVAPAADVAAAMDAGVALESIVPFGRFYFEGHGPVAEMADVHADLLAAVATTVAGVAHLGVEGAAEFDEVLDGPLVECGPAVAAVRAVKLPGEITLLTYGARLVDRAIDAALATAGPGTTEQEMADVIAATMSAGGGLPRFVVATTGPRTALADAAPTGREWRPGELARFDVGCTVAGYWSDIGRTAVLGGPDTLQASRYDAILAGEQAQFELARPGVTASEVFAAAVTPVEAGGISPYRRHHCGHGIGLSVYEAPIISPGVELPLREGMTFCFETPFYEVGWGGMMVEDLVEITGDGLRVLTVGDRSLRVVSA